MMVYKIEFYVYLPKILNIFFSSFRIKVGSGSGFFSLAELDPYPGGKMLEPHP